MSIQNPEDTNKKMTKMSIGKINLTATHTQKYDLNASFTNWLLTPFNTESPKYTSVQLPNISNQNNIRKQRDFIRLQMEKGK